MSRGLRNCNPGNIRITKDKWQGLREVQEDKSFFQFTEMKWGYRALIRTLQNYRIKWGCQTIADFINRWAPPVENNTSGYISRVCREMQVPNSYVPDINDKATMCVFAAAISQVENGVPAVMADIEKGWELL
ncbi:structural protein P5 [uncultured Bacteroides sp.]|uniref:structural protein P5 n=1 Tax=uncultured Bacteroides sp. TaxID=162156 RepID=UPI0025F2572E|nr:structural protein P5 [uncultured Bacteroides sp.]